MSDLKHVGRIKSNGRKVIVAYRTLPGDPYNCLVVQTENLSPEQHDSIVSLVESSSGQSCYEFAEVLGRSKFPDGSTMLAALHKQGRLNKVPTDAVDMVPNTRVSIPLDELNRIIASQRGVSIEDLAIKPSSSKEESVAKPTAPVAPTALSDEDLAKQYRADAARLSKEAAALRRMADELSPKKSKSKDSE